jgi:DNA-binding HxlR family transcriptional regulator
MLTMFLKVTRTVSPDCWLCNAKSARLPCSGMEWREASTENCPVGRALDLLGEKWTLLLVRDALQGVRRFEDFRQHVGLSEAVLSDRLRKLVEAGVLVTVPYQEAGRRERHEYRVSPKGRELTTVIIALKQWGEEFHPDPKGPVMVIRHRECGGSVRAALRCEKHAESALSVYDVVGKPGSGARKSKRPLPKRA